MVETYTTIAGETDPAYWNMVGPFGGWIATQLLQAVLDDPRRRGDPISTSTNFAGAIEAGPFAVRVRHLRANRSTDFWWSELVQTQDGEERVCAYASIVLAQRRASLSHLEETPPDAPPPEGLKQRVAPMRLSWFAHFDMRIAQGDPFIDAAVSRTLTWTRKAGVPLDFTTLTEICDTAIPRIFFRTRMPIPIATVTLNVYFHASAEELGAIGTDFVLCDGRWRIAHDGYFDEQQAVWSRAGRLLATTEQLVWFKLTDEARAALADKSDRP